MSSKQEIPTESTDVSQHDPRFSHSFFRYSTVPQSAAGFTIEDDEVREMMKVLSDMKSTLCAQMDTVTTMFDRLSMRLGPQVSSSVKHGSGVVASSVPTAADLVALARVPATPGVEGSKRSEPVLAMTGTALPSSGVPIFDYAESSPTSMFKVLEINPFRFDARHMLNSDIFCRLAERAYSIRAPQVKASMQRFRTQRGIECEIDLGVGWRVTGRGPTESTAIESAEISAIIEIVRVMPEVLFIDVPDPSSHITYESLSNFIRDNTRRRSGPLNAEVSGENARYGCRLTFDGVFIGAGAGSRKVTAQASAASSVLMQLRHECVGLRASILDGIPLKQLAMSFFD